MAITWTRKGFGVVDGKQYVDFDAVADGAGAANVNLATVIGLKTVDEVWVKPDSTTTVVSTTTLPVHGTADISINPGAADTLRVRFVGSGG